VGNFSERRQGCDARLRAAQWGVLEMGEMSRTIEPPRIVHTGIRWHVLAWDPDRDAWRTLRLDRLHPRLPMPASFSPRAISDDAVRDLTIRSITSAPYRHRYRVDSLSGRLSRAATAGLSLRGG
jgi:hypothetical protein